MAPSSQDAQSQPRRPPAVRQSSSSSFMTSQSPSDGISSSQKAAPHKHQRHVVGQSRMGPRNTSFGKNLNKLNKLAQAQGGDAAAGAKHHRRSHSGTSTSTPSSPARPAFKRNASTVGIVRHNTHTHTHAALKKNLSSGHLSRQGSSKNMLKSTKNEIAPSKRSLTHPGKTRHSPEDHPTVHFDVGNEEAQDDAWTEESASQSPTTTRSNTRQNSVILDSSKAPSAEESETEASEPARPVSKIPDYQTPPSPMTRYQPDQILLKQPNGSSSHHSRPPDADMITSRLLQRSASHHIPPQMSSISATVVPDSHERSVGHSQGSTLADTPGRDLVSRFMDGDSSGGTPNSNFLPPRNSPKAQPADLGAQQRNKSTPNMAATATHSRAQSRRSGTSTPTDLPPSRTQQKLLLQRASSNIEPQKLVPVILPRTGGPTLLNSGMPYAASSEGRLDPRLKHQFEHISQEYNVIRRYRNPLVDAINRLDQMPSRPRKTATMPSSIANGFVAIGSTLDGIGESPSTSFRDSGSAGDGADRRRSRVSFDGARDDVEGRQSFDSDNGRVRNEVDEICRRLWESTEIVDSE
ncbi:uncharacterized protein BDZ99DRAFT_200042 [Mytilinidion resinicola]|uniref:Uncharacterized protein n=1 Tax=Mytilinidion resinicola TaxID=574789 RepID=A0A6A6Y2E1_9PEZI|nr:uncharacterized protein BDZ99DRAFT_200042 [Mytilinidion resinicola]KAF2802809.1 hypothetical protein BDZ99DRAFT_200042 [Mytilinidion resinicola]